MRPMNPRNTLSRREFVAGASSLLLAGAMPGVAKPAVQAKLALLGGEKAVKASVSHGPRWGAPEQERLTAMLKQSALFYWKGPQTEAMLERFKNVCPVKWAHTCSSGTAAIHIAVAAAGIGPGDEVITSPITDIGTVIGVIYQQGVPVFADLGPGTYNLDVADVERRITPKTKAIIAVHLTGNPCDMDALKALADRYNLVLIEDCAQAWGAKYRGRPIGWPRYRAPHAWAQSSIRTSLWRSARAFRACMSHGLPVRCTAMIALVFVVIRRSTSAGSKLYVPAPRSANTGTACW
jgi:perosamine synthetase